MIVRDHKDGGLSPEEIVPQYRYLTLSEVHAALTYYHEHQDEIDQEIQEENSLFGEVSQTNQPPVAERLCSLKKRSRCP